MLLDITHRTTYAYDPPAARLALRLRLFPSEFDGQRVLDWSVRVNDDPVERLHIDGFGDSVGLWCAHEPCAGVEVVASGVIETVDKAGVVARLPRRPPPNVFLRETELTTPDDAIRGLADQAPSEDPLGRLHALMDLVADAVTYRSGSTTTRSTAAEVLAQGAGVCQDHAHVFISAARSFGVPARYASGYLLPDPEPEEGEEPDAPRDEGLRALSETHAWAEAHVEGIGWIGFDPANRVCPTDRYARLGCGLDADHAAPIRGSVSGDSAVSLTARVEIAEGAAETQSQSQSQSQSQQ